MHIFYTRERADAKKRFTAEIEGRNPAIFQIG